MTSWRKPDMGYIRPTQLAVTLSVAFVTFVASLQAAESQLEHFINARDGQLWDCEKPFRFISMNIPNLLLVEDNVPFTQENPWRSPDKFEINDALATVAAMGGTVARTYVISVVKTNDLPGTPRHVLGP